MYSYFLTASLRALPALNAGTLLAGISISSPVCGLRPLRAARSRTSKVPNPIICTFSLSPSVSMTVSNTASTALPASFFERSLDSATELINAVAESSDLSKKDAGKAVDAVFETVMDTLGESEKVQIIGFGTFEVRDRAARKGRNPQTGEEIEIPASKVPAFKAGKALRDAVKK